MTTQLAGRVVVLLGVAATIACGGSSASPAPTMPDASSTREQVAPSPTVEPVPTSSPAPTVNPDRCPSPYRAGTNAGDRGPRLQPSGTAAPIDSFVPDATIEDESLERAIRDVLGAEVPHVSVVVKDLESNSGVSINAGRVFYPASLFKIWIMLEAFHQRDAGLLDFGESYIVSSYYEGLRLNDGELEPCSQVTVDGLLHAMMSVSDNIAANMLYDRVGYANVNQVLAQLGLGFSGLLEEGSLQTTASGMATVLEAIAHGEAVSPAASLEMAALLQANVIDDRIPALLPPGTPIAHKTGNWDNATHDVGIVYSPAGDYIIAVLTDYGYVEDGARYIARLSKTVYDYYNAPG